MDDNTYNYNITLEEKMNKDDIIVTKDELYLQQAPSLNFELDADELLEKALLRGFVEKVGDDKYKINNDYSGSQK